jgi:hypothetical protein
MTLSKGSDPTFLAIFHVPLGQAEKETARVAAGFGRHGQGVCLDRGNHGHSS